MSNLERYRALVGDLPRPTDEQMEAFAHFVCGAHSWYKHLPFFPPGSPFQFYLDPSAGMQLVRRSKTRFEVALREEKGFHYSDLPTAERRERFAFLGFCRRAGTAIIHPRGDGSLEVPSDDAPMIFSEETGGLVPLPPEVLEAGRVHVTGAVHEFQLPGLWLSRVARMKSEPSWPEESGGREALNAILERCRQLEEDPDCFEEAPPDSELAGHQRDYPLNRLLEPERRRQRRAMVAAMERVLDLVAPPQGSKT